MFGRINFQFLNEFSSYNLIKLGLVLIARSDELGLAAVAEIKSEIPDLCADLRFHRLDITNKSTVQALKVEEVD